MKKVFAIFLFALYVNLVQGQFYTVSGYISDKETAERLIGASICDVHNKGTLSNNYGFYSITLPKGQVKLISSYVGYQKKDFLFFLEKDTIVNFNLNPNTEIEEVVITSSTALFNTNVPNFYKVTSISLNKLTGFVGENDPFKAYLLLPGVQQGQEGSSGLHIRGGSPDQNLILLDDIPIYNAEHLGGYFSVFNPDAIKSVELMKGYFPARYGSRLSSVIDVRLKDGNAQKLMVNGSVGIVSSSLTIDGPLIKEKTTFLISARRSYLDLLSNTFNKYQHKDYDIYKDGFYFYDIISKVTHRFSNKSSLYLSGYFGFDEILYHTELTKSQTQFEKLKRNVDWGNKTFGARWNYLFSNKLFSNTTITYTSYNFNTNTQNKSISNIQETNFNFNYNSNLSDLTAKVDMDLYYSTIHHFEFGIISSLHAFNPGNRDIFASNSSTGQNIDTVFSNTPLTSVDYSFYLTDNIKVSEKTDIGIGIRQVIYQINSWYSTSFEPRLFVNYLINSNLKFNIAYCASSQSIHLLTNNTVSLPTDLWLPATKKVMPEKAHQFSILLDHGLTFGSISLGGYYKEMTNLVEYKEGVASYAFDEQWEDIVTLGDGTSYGSELLLIKKNGNLTGSLGYTLSWSDRKFKELNFGNSFPYKYDRRHNIAIQGNYKINNKISLSSSWNYTTGYAATLPVAHYPIARGYAYFYNGRNGFRTPSFHKLDFAINLSKQKKWGERIWQFGVYNAYNRKNVSEMYIEHYGSDVGKVKYMSLFSVIPFVSLKFKYIQP